jgi:hypothetical protein
MVALRSRRLESLLGTSLEHVQAHHLYALVNGHVAEDTDLDKNKYELPKDVAALANAAGGIIILGIVEKDGRAERANLLELRDSELGRIQQIVAEKVSPIPHFDLITVPATSPPLPTAGAEPGRLQGTGGADQADQDQETSPGTPKSDTTDGPNGQASQDGPGPEDPSGRSGHQGFVIIAVTRSPRAPHALQVDKELTWRYPKRHGTSTRFLSATEVATAYRNSWAAEAHLGERLAQVTAEATQHLDLTEGWLLLTLAPQLPGDLILTAEVAQQFHDQWQDRQALLTMSGLQFARTGVRRRKLTADGAHIGDQAQWASLEMHCDGCGAYAIKLHDTGSAEPARASDGQRPTMISDQMIAGGVLTALVRLGAHARDRTAAGGNALIRATLIPPHQGQSRTRFAIHRADQPFGERESPVSTINHIQAETLTPLDDLAAASGDSIADAPTPGTLATAAVLTDELFQAFGIPEAGYFTRSGHLRASSWPAQQREAITQWAKHHHLPITS